MGTLTHRAHRLPARLLLVLALLAASLPAGLVTNGGGFPG